MYPRPTDIDRSLNEVPVDEMSDYRPDYYNRPSNTIDCIRVDISSCFSLLLISLRASLSSLLSPPSLPPPLSLCSLTSLLPLLFSGQNGGVKFSIS